MEQENKIIRDEKGRFIKGFHSHYNTEFKKGNISKYKGKTFEERYGNEKAKELKENFSNKMKGRNVWNKGTKGLIKPNSGSFKKGNIPISKFEKGHIPYMKGKKHSIEAIKKIKEKRTKQIYPMQDTAIEIKIQEFLKLLGIEYIAHSFISEIEHKYRCDILIPSTKTIIECDGDYWHGNPNVFKKFNELQLKQIEEDNIRNKELSEKGFKILRLWERDIKVMNLNKFQEVLL